MHKPQNEEQDEAEKGDSLHGEDQHSHVGQWGGGDVAGRGWFGTGSWPMVVGGRGALPR